MSDTGISIALTGSGGSGVMTAGSLLLEAAARAGWYGCMTRSLGPQIRGGEAAALLRLAPTPVESHGDRFDALLAIDWGNAGRFADEIALDGDSLTLGDPKAGKVPPEIAAMGARHVDVTLTATAKAIAGARPNMVALGVGAHLLGLGEDAIGEVIDHHLAAKGEEALRSSRAAVAAGLALAADLPVLALPPDAAGHGERWQMSGNEAAGLGAIRGGIRYVGAYPITPATDLLEWLAPRLRDIGGVLVQAEDELASIKQIIGASFGGVPSLTATTGPGLALMMEGIGLAVASETPVVVVDVMRGGPSTGIPTKSEQSDLNIALYGLHGDAPHLVLAPTSIADCLLTAQWAVHLAETLQSAAIVLSDQALGQTRAVLDRPADVRFITRRRIAEQAGEDYRRYAIDAAGVSEMALPGLAGGTYTADGLEHGAAGTPSSLSADHLAQLDKRQRKLADFDYGEHWAEIRGEGDTAILTWGSSTAPVREAVARLSAGGRRCRLVALRLLLPARPEHLAAALDGVGPDRAAVDRGNGRFEAHHQNNDSEESEGGDCHDDEAPAFALGGEFGAGYVHVASSYSLLKQTEGLTCVARMAGMILAANAC